MLGDPTMADIDFSPSHIRSDSGDDEGEEVFEWHRVTLQSKKWVQARLRIPM